MKAQLKELSREALQKIILGIAESLTMEQTQKLQALIEKSSAENKGAGKPLVPARMSQELIDEKMEQMKSWMREIDEGEVYLNAEEYEDYSAGYWNRELVTEYYDNQGIGHKLTSIIEFAKDCVDDRHYPEANFLYEWLWDMCVYPDEEYIEAADLQTLTEKGIIKTDMKQLALLSLYADYQVQEADQRAEDIYLYFSSFAFLQIHIEDMFHVGHENLSGTEEFLEDWIGLLKTKSGDMESRLLKEAVLYKDGVEGIVRMADENGQTHPGLYLAAIDEYEKTHNYTEIEKVGESALERIDSGLVIRSRIALRAAHAASCLGHSENVMRFCWEAFRSDSTEKNFLRLFGTKEMAEKYGMRGMEILDAGVRGTGGGYAAGTELVRNYIGDYGYYTLKFYTGDFETVRQASKNPKGSLGWSTSYIRCGIRLFLLYLYDEPLPSKAAGYLARSIGFADESESCHLLDFEREIIEESRRHNMSIFWNYFQRWKSYFPMDAEEKKTYIRWAEKIVRNRADAIVGGQHRGHYQDAAALLAVAAECKESLGEKGAIREVFAEYKNKFPRHSSFQAEMKSFFGK